MSRFNLIPSGTKRDLLLLIKHRGTISLDDAEQATSLTRTTLREHLGSLERDGLVSRSTKRYGRGRPSLLYSLTSDAANLFPSRDHELLGSLLEFLERSGRSDLINSFFRRYWADRLTDMKHRIATLEPDDDTGRTRILQELLTEEGFMPYFSSDKSGLAIRECNCPFPEAVKRTRLPCRLEAEFLAKVLDKPLERVSYIPDGATACTYEFGLTESTVPLESNAD